MHLITFFLPALLFLFLRQATCYLSYLLHPHTVTRSSKKVKGLTVSADLFRSEVFSLPLILLTHSYTLQLYYFITLSAYNKSPMHQLTFLSPPTQTMNVPCLFSAQKGPTGDTSYSAHRFLSLSENPGCVTAYINVRRQRRIFCLARVRHFPSTTELHINQENFQQKHLPLCIICC